MRRAIAGLVLAAFGAVLTVRAFDAAAWGRRHDAMAREAERMRLAFTEYSAKVDIPAEEVTIPFETYDSGSVKSVVYARRGKFFDDSGFVWADGITVEQYDEQGEVEMHLVAGSCLIDRAARCCWISGHTRAEHRKTVLEGDDAFYCSSNEYLKVMSNVQVVSEDVKMKGLRL